MGDDDDDQEYLEDEFVEDVNFIEENTTLETQEDHFHEDHFQEDKAPADSGEKVLDLDSSRMLESLRLQETKSSNLPISGPTSIIVIRSDRIKWPQPGGMKK